MAEDIHEIKELVIAQIQELADRQQALQDEIRCIDDKMLQLARLVDELDRLEHNGVTIYDRPDLKERIMGIPNDARNPLSRQSFKDAFRRMGF